MKRECGKEESIPERGGGPERSRAEGEETLSYIGPITAIPVSGIIIYQIATVPVCSISGNSNVVVPVCGISGIQIATVTDNDIKHYFG